MQNITHISGKVIPLSMSDVDTDLIIPAQYLTSVTREGYGQNLFKRLRDTDPNFILNQSNFSDANILLTQENFGCGSSREQAVWALQEVGIKAIIGISFADIFYQNAFQNQLLLVALPKEINSIMMSFALQGNYIININLDKSYISSTAHENFAFEIDSFQKYCIMNCLDDLSYLLNFSNEIKQFKMKKFKNYTNSIHFTK